MNTSRRRGAWSRERDVSTGILQARGGWMLSAAGTPQDPALPKVGCSPAPRVSRVATPNIRPCRDLYLDAMPAPAPSRYGAFRSKIQWTTHTRPNTAQHDLQKHRSLAGVKTLIELVGRGRTR